MTHTAHSYPAGWYPDPYVTGQQRYYDGHAWTGLTNAPTASMHVVDADSIHTGNLTYGHSVTGTVATREVPVETLTAHHSQTGGNAAHSMAAHEYWAEAGRDTVEPLPGRPVELAVPSPPPTVDSALDSLFDPPAHVQIPGARRAATRAALTGSFARRAARLAAFVVLATSLVLIGFTLWENWGSNWYAERAQSALRDEYDQLTYAMAPADIDAAGVTAGPVELPDPATLTSKEPYGRLIIERIGVDHIVVGGTSKDALKHGPGIWEHGVFPGATGNATVAGHRTTYGGPFRHIDQLEVGDRIVFKSPGRPDAVFEVRGSAIVPPSQVSVTQQTDGVRLTLTTCDPVGSTAMRLVVQAELIEGSNADFATPADSWQFAG